MRSAARMEKEFGRGIKEKSKGILWKRSARGSTPIRTRVVHKGGNSNIHKV